MIRNRRAHRGRSRSSSDQTTQPARWFADEAIADCVAEGPGVRLGHECREASAKRVDVTAEQTRRLRFRLSRRRLDDQIAAEAPPPDSVDIRRRCAELTARGSRLCLASALDNILDAAEERWRDPASALILDHEAVLRDRGQIEELIDRLRSGQSVSARGVALVRLLLRDSRGPLYRHRDDETLHDALSEIARALSCR